MPGAMQPLTEGRKATFLKVLAECGIFVWAARAASPYAKDEKGCASSFRTLMRKDPGFSAQVAEAREEADAKIEHEAFRRAVEGVKTPVFQKGVQAVTASGEPAFVQNYSDRLLERLLESRMPEKWAQRKHLTVDGQVTHAPASGILTLTVDDVMALNPSDRQALGHLLEKVKVARDGETPALEHKPGEVIDVEAVEVVEPESVRVTREIKE